MHRLPMRRPDLGTGNAGWPLPPAGTGLAQVAAGLLHCHEAARAVGFSLFPVEAAFPALISKGVLWVGGLVCLEGPSQVGWLLAGIVLGLVLASWRGLP